MCYTLPKIWKGRIQKYWDKLMPSPSSYPNSGSEFSLKFDTPEITDAVSQMEAEIGTEESVINDLLPENVYLGSYVGVYDVKATPGELTLLSPEKVDSEEYIAVHYNAENEAWENIEDTQLIDGYVWGTLEDFSPVAIFTYHKEIHHESSIEGVSGSSYIICEGNTVQGTKRDDKFYVTNMNSGYEIEVPQGTILVGGSADGSAIDTTSITLIDINTNTHIAKVVGGSLYVGEGNTTVNEINVNFIRSAGTCTGSFGAVRTNVANFNMEDSVLAWFGVGEGFRGVNDSNPNFGSRAWLGKANIKMVNVRSYLTFCGQNCEYFYVDETEGYFEGGQHDYLINGGSNARTNKTSLVANGVKIGIYQSTNRGDVAQASAKFTNCNVDHLFVGGDPTDSTVTGTTQKLRIEINAGNGVYNIENGTEAGVALTAEDIERIVEFVKVSRNAGEITISDDYKALLGDRYIIK